MSDAPRRVAVGTGSAAGTIGAGAGWDERGGAGAPVGSLSTVPTSSMPSGSRPFIAAMLAAGTPELAASWPRESPGRTV